MKPAPLPWRMCCKTIYSTGAQHVTYHNLTDSDRSLSAVVAGYTKPNVDGLIIINSTDSIFLSNEFISKEGGIPSSSPPVYVVSSHDGGKLKEFLDVNQESVEVKVLIESTMDSGAPHCMSGGVCVCVCACVCVCVVRMCVGVSLPPRVLKIAHIKMHRSQPVKPVLQFSVSLYDSCY